MKDLTKGSPLSLILFFGCTDFTWKYVSTAI